MKYAEALVIAEDTVALLTPHCARISIAGSVLRGEPDPGDIEIVAIPKPYDIGLFASGIAPIVDRWPIVKGHLPCKYTRRVLPGGMELDLFLATAENWGLILAIRTGSAAYSHEVLASAWSRRGYKSIKGLLHNSAGKPVPTPEEADVFRICDVPWVPPTERNRGGTWGAVEEEPEKQVVTLPARTGIDRFTTRNRTLDEIILAGVAGLTALELAKKWGVRAESLRPTFEGLKTTGEIWQAADLVTHERIERSGWPAWRV